MQRFFRNIERYLLIIISILLVTDVILGIVARYVQFEVVFAEEIGKYLFIWLCTIGIAAAAKEKRHIRVTWFLEKLLLSSNFFWLFSQVCFLVLALFFTYWGVQLAYFHVVMNKSVMGFRFPMVFFSVSIPVGFGLTSVRILQNLYRILIKQENGPCLEKKEEGL